MIQERRSGWQQIGVRMAGKWLKEQNETMWKGRTQVQYIRVVSGGKTRRKTLYINHIN